MLAALVRKLPLSRRDHNFSSPNPKTNPTQLSVSVLRSGTGESNWGPKVVAVEWENDDKVILRRVRGKKGSVLDQGRRRLLNCRKGHLMGFWKSGVYYEKGRVRFVTVTKTTGEGK